ncbi:MAG: ABC transporter substrate-binding protein [Dehalococcoidia bacterium]|nr:ABC transporter substrate-binding protein [Dehalococcoidia bacterium]
MALNDERWSRRRLLTGTAGVAAGLAAMGVVGCGDDDDNDKSSSGNNGGTTPAGPGATTAPSKETPKKGGTLTAAQIGGDILLNTGLPFVSLPQNRYLGMLTMEPLMRYNDSLKPELVLVDRYELAPDFTKATVSLKQGLTFHNGAPVTPEDVFFGIDVIINPKNFGVTGNFQLVNFAKMITEKKKVDDRTMEFTFDKPRVNITDFFAQLFVTQKSSYEKLMKGEDIQGTGAYMFKSWTPNQSHTMVRNPNYHLTSKYGGPYLDSVVVNNFADADAAALAFESGSVDMILSLAITGTVAKRFRDKKQTRVAPKTGLSYAGAVVTNPLLKDARVRQAMFLAIDRKRFQQELGEGFSTLTAQPWPSTSPAFEEKYEAAFYDTARAKDLLEQAGFSQSQPLKLEYASATYQTQATVLKENWEAIGVRVDLAPMEANAFTQKFAARQLTDLFISGHSFSDMAPLTNFQQTFPYRIPNIEYYGEPGSNTGQEYVQMIKDLETMDPLGDPAKAVYKRFNELFVTEAWILPFAPYDRIDLVGSKVQGFDPYMIEPGAGFPNPATLWKKA